MLRLENIAWNSPDGKDILKGVDLTVDDGKMVVITGPNGGGKTTLARVIAGIEQPAAGKIIREGHHESGCHGAGEGGHQLCFSAAGALQGYYRAAAGGDGGRGQAVGESDV